MSVYDFNFASLEFDSGVVFPGENCFVPPPRNISLSYQIYLLGVRWSGVDFPQENWIVPPPPLNISLSYQVYLLGVRWSGIDFPQEN
jgi:hypothetical protein